uniref:Type II GnRH receptor n=1 Tax=Neogobius melanostomus TaxID=47308 RepID=A0A8C6SIP9_9GOBI
PGGNSFLLLYTLKNLLLEFIFEQWAEPRFTLAAQCRVVATLLLCVVASLSNSCVLVSVWRARGLASHLRPLLLSLAGAHLMGALLVMPMDAAWNVTVQWRGGAVLCKVLCFLKLLCMHASAHVVIVISLDRQHAILRPLHALNAHQRNRRMLATAWALSVVLATPQLFIFRLSKAEDVDFTQCATHGSFSQRWQETLYNMFHFSTLYVCPLVVMVWCYSCILLQIQRQATVQKAGEWSLRRSGTDIIPKARMKTVKMSVVIVLSFVVCWTPYYLLGLWYWFQPEVLRYTPEYVHHGLFVFGNLNSCLDPLIYGFYSPSFRAGLRQCCGRRQSGATGTRGLGQSPGRGKKSPRDEHELESMSPEHGSWSDEQLRLSPEPRNLKRVQ